ncbi:MAG: response regulator [Scytonema hyalinum WJT4-NPBG1]|jgi:signal transduction histidine kinase/CheY-like chemotaxis protein|nr:response regulator [Scytonema hyalinum WJT4-NPBG1]
MDCNQQLTPNQESERLRALRRYEILDTPPDGAFESITSIAAKLLKVPISIVSLVDSDRIWFKSHHGLEVQQIDRTPGLCASAILSNEVYTITDASKDVRSLTNPLVVGEMGLRFYAAAPLQTHDGHNLGTLCVIDKQPRSISEEEKSILTDLAAVVIDEMELRLAARKVAQLNAELAQAKEAAEVANNAKSAFLANMSHELRSPLNAILGFSQLMVRSNTLCAENKENVSMIMRSGEHLLSLINQVLDFSKIEAGHATLNEKNFDLYQLLDELENMFQLRATNKGLDLLIIPTSLLPQYVRTDEVKLRQVLINLLSNAIKFTSFGKVTVRVSAFSNQLSSAEENTQQRIYFEVEDTGAGIAADDLDKVFEAFVQTKTGRESQEGTGLGLAITRKFVQLMGGEISVSSQVGCSTTFKFNIQASVVAPMDLERQQSKPTVVALEPNQPSYRIMIVDDQPINRQLLHKLLKPLGFELQEATNGKEAVEVWESWEPHCIFMDMRMPVMDGYEATKHIKSALKGQATAVIALTASALEDEKAIVLSVGCDDFLGKPFREADIFATMQKHIGVRYVYDVPSTKSTSTNIEAGVVTPADVEKLTEGIAALPLDIVTNLYQATINLDLDEMLTIIAQIRQSNEALAHNLADLANNFQYQRILTLTQPIAG